MDARRLRVTGPASRFLNLLEDFGHVADDVPSRLLLGAVEVGPVDADVTLTDVRRAAAVWMFASIPDGPADGPAGATVMQDWSLLFS